MSPGLEFPLSSAIVRFDFLGHEGRLRRRGIGRPTAPCLTPKRATRADTVIAPPELFELSTEMAITSSGVGQRAHVVLPLFSAVL